MVHPGGSTRSTDVQTRFRGVCGDLLWVLRVAGCRKPVSRVSRAILELTANRDGSTL